MRERKVLVLGSEFCLIQGFGPQNLDFSICVSYLHHRNGPTLKPSGKMTTACLLQRFDLACNVLNNLGRAVVGMFHYKVMPKSVGSITVCGGSAETEKVSISG